MKKLVKGQLIDMTPEEEAAHVASMSAEPERPFPDRIRKAFEQLPVATQKRYKDEIRDAAFFLERNNIPMVQEFIRDAEEKLLPEETAVKAIIDAAKVELGM